MRITGEIVYGSGTSFTLAHPPTENTLALYGAGVRLTGGVGADYTLNGSVITILNGSYDAGQVAADYETIDTPTNGTISGSDTLSPYALTTLQRVKDVLFDPNNTILLNGAALVNGSQAVTAFAIPAGRTVVAGQQIRGLGILPGTIITSISGNTLTLSQNAVASNTGQTLTVVDQTPAYDAMLIRMINGVSKFIGNYCNRPNGFVEMEYANEIYSTEECHQRSLYLRNTPVSEITKFQWRAGTPADPVWTDFLVNDYELANVRIDPITGTQTSDTGEIRVYGMLPSHATNAVRVSYVAGYPVDWEHAGENTTHKLPEDLSIVADNLVVRRFKRRGLAGQSSQSLEGATTSGWRNVLDAEDTETLDQYKVISF
ncbi:hypothetical protein [Rhodopseudomonas palustris]|uniref:hypothetical protein n=1 Tax=Rhodopseudomonas palustris TaxID=1076 RepID=UPI000D1A4205|nr:hypothetical protein [Rhodopseudomonas palustris]AVT83668.1 hypothetical protein RPYSC3_48080 [Rhodopseudomonas palustris]